MFEPTVVCGRTFSPELLQHLNGLGRAEPPPSRRLLAQEACTHLAWYSADGRLALSSAKVALRKLDRRGLLRLPARRAAAPTSHRLRGSGTRLPPVVKVPSRVDHLASLHLYLLSGKDDPLHLLWNDLIIAQHPCGDAPLVGAQLRYLIGSEHGWLGALGFGPAAFVLQPRDQWIGWSTSARLGHLKKVVCLSRLLVRQEVRCANLVSKVLSMVVERVAQDWQARYGLKPLLIETYVDRSRFSGGSLRAANWMRVGTSSGRGRLGPKKAVKTFKDVWLLALNRQTRQKLQAQVAAPLTPRPLLRSLDHSNWCNEELDGLELGDRRRTQRALQILQARWEQPQASFYGSFADWTPAKGAYGFIEHPDPGINLQSLLSAHREATQARMAAESVVLLPQDTTTLNYTGLKKTTGLGMLRDEGGGRGLHLHSMLAFRPDGIPLGVVDVQCWARPQPTVVARRRNAKSIEEKESYRWLHMFQVAASVARRMPQTKLVNIADREGDLYEVHTAGTACPPNLHVLVRAQHDRNLQEHQKLWDFMAALPAGAPREIDLPRSRQRAACKATVQVRWSAVTIQPPAVPCKESWPSVTLWAVWVHEPAPPEGAEPIDWMLLTDMPTQSFEQAWQCMEWYRRRWGIEEWHRALKTGCGVEQREFKTAEHLQRALAFDLIVAWRILACVKLGRQLPQLPATLLYTADELAVLLARFKKNPTLRRSLV